MQTLNLRLIFLTIALLGLLPSKGQDLHLHFENHDSIAYKDHDTENRFKNNLPDGIHYLLDSSYRVLRICTIQSGLKSGKEYIYGWDGELRSSVNYSQGKREGESIYYVWHFTRAIYHFKNDSLHGEFRVYAFPYSKKKQNHYLRIAGAFERGVPTGVWNVYNRKNEIRRQYFYEDGIQYLLFDLEELNTWNGKLVREGFSEDYYFNYRYKNGQLNGNSYWYINSKLARKWKYKDGILRKSTSFYNSKKSGSTEYAISQNQDLDPRYALMGLALQVETHYFPWPSWFYDDPTTVAHGIHKAWDNHRLSKKGKFHQGNPSGRWVINYRSGRPWVKFNLNSETFRYYDANGKLIHSDYLPYFKDLYFKVYYFQGNLGEQEIILSSKTPSHGLGLFLYKEGEVKIKSTLSCGKSFTNQEGYFTPYADHIVFQLKDVFADDHPNNYIQYKYSISINENGNYILKLMDNNL